MTPPEQLFALLAGARRAGDDFAAAWPAAVDQALDGEQGAELDDRRVALDETRDAWDAAWGRRPQTRAQRALVAVANDPDRVELEGDPDGRYCALCATSIDDADVQARYCSPTCRSRAYAARRAA